MGRPVRSADVTELRAFCAAIDLGSLGRAARLLRISQPALSKRIRALEALASTSLLDRAPRGVAPPPAGTRLYVEARKLLVQAEAVEGLLAGLHDEEVPVRLAASHTIAEFVLPGPLVEFEARREHHLSVELVIANSLLVRQTVREGRADFGIAAAEPRPEGAGSVLRELPFLEDEVVVAVPERHAWADAEVVELPELARTPMVVRDPGANTRRVVEAALTERGLALAPPLAEVGSTSAAKATAVSEGAPVLLSKLALADRGDGLVCVPIRDAPFTRRFVILVGGERTLAPGAAALLHHLEARVGGKA
jgi:DNA-binding transcriptional LysR family regulator